MVSDGRIFHPSAMDPYEVLQVHPRAEAEVIRAAYRALARKHHPDLGGDPKRMSLLNDAWAIVGSARRRALHDAARRAAPATSVAPARKPEAPSPARRETSVRYEPRADVESEPVFATAATAATGPTGRPPVGQRGTVIDFGRYAGWSVVEVSRLDPDYLLWLERTPIGRRLSPEIQAVLTERGAVATAPATRNRGRWRR